MKKEIRVRRVKGSFGVVFAFSFLLLGMPLFATDNSVGHTIKLATMDDSNRKMNYDDLRLAMEDNNLELKKAREDLVQSQLDVKDAKAGYQPKIDLTFGVQYDAFPMLGDVTLKKGQYKIDNIDLPATQINVPKDKLPAKPPFNELPDKIDIPAQNIPLDPAIEIPNKDIKIFDGMPNWGYSLGLDLQQPIYTWGKISNSVKLYSTVADVKNVQYSSKISQLDAALKGNLAALYYLQQMEKLLSDQMEYVTELVALSEDGVKQGVLLNQDVLEAKMQAALVPVTIAEIHSNKNNVVADLRIITGLPNLTENDIFVVPDEEFFYALIDVSKEELEELALDPQQDTFVMLDKLANVTAYAKKIADGAIYGKPDIAFQGSVGFQGDIEKLFKGKAKFDESFSAKASIGLKTTLWDGGKKLNDIKRAESKFNSAVIDRETAEASVKQELNKQYNALNIAKLRIDYQTLKIETAQSDINKAEELARSGYGSKTDVLQAKITKATEEINLLKEKLNLSTAAYTIEAMIS